MDNLVRTNLENLNRLPTSVQSVKSGKNPYIKKTPSLQEIKSLHNPVNNYQGQPVMMIILDGWGYRDNFEANAIADAKTPVMNSLISKHPHTLLNTKGIYIGDPSNVRNGNSEDGHVSIGSGRAMPNLSARISNEIRDRIFFKNSELNNAVDHVTKLKNQGIDSKFNLMGLVSTNSSHAKLSHLYALIKLAKQKGLADEDIKLNLILDGRDDPPVMAPRLIKLIQNRFPNIEITSLTGRDLAMDRKNNHEKTNTFFDALTKSSPYQANSTQEALEKYFDNNSTEELMPAYITSKTKRPAISKNDALVFFNTRADRAKQTARKFIKMEKENSNFHFTALGDYDLGNTAYNIAYKKQPVIGGLMQVLDNLGLPVKKIAESEKAAHVGYFFNGATNREFAHESRQIIDSLNTNDYSKTPEMKSVELADAAIDTLQANKHPFTVINFAAPDMIGHTGNMKATKEAIEIVDKELGRIVTQAKKSGAKLVITADHGNAEHMRNEKNQILTGHSKSPVPFIVADYSKASSKKPLSLRFNNDNNSLGLSNIAATVLELMNLKVPEYMDKSLISKSKQAPIVKWGQKMFNEMRKYTDQPIKNS